MDESKSQTTLLLDIYRDIGVLQGSVDILLKERGEASTSRRKIYEEIKSVENSLHKKITMLTSELMPVIDDMKELKPIVRGLEEKRIQAVGAVWALRAVWLAAAGLLGSLITIAAKWK